MRNRVLPALLSMALVVCLGTSAAEARASTILPQLSFRGNTVECSVMIREPGQQITATLELWEGCTLLDSWSGSGSSVLNLEGSHRAVSGRTYTVEVYGTIDGEAFEAASLSKTYSY